MDPLAYALIGAAVGFAFSMGAHYTGACMGMPCAAGALRPSRALVLMAPATLLGAYLASGGVETTVGHALLAASSVSIGVALVIVVSAFVLTSLYNVARVPTSTIQILVFAVVGAGLARGLPVEWRTIELLVVLWAAAPVAAFGLGYLTIRLADRLVPGTARGLALSRTALVLLLTVGLAASFAMGANDVANATGAFLMTGLFGTMSSGLIGGVALAVGVLSWGRPLLERVASGIVKLDPRMAMSAQFAQAATILASVSFGLFTSMNQALVGGMLGVGLARDQTTVDRKVVRGILVGWAVGPASGIGLAFAVALLLGRWNVL